MPKDKLKFCYQDIGGLSVPTVEFVDPKSSPLCLTVFGEIASWSDRSNPTARKIGQDWRIKIARAIAAAIDARSDSVRTGDYYTISIGMAFRRENKHDIDVDNRIKPIVDAAATALFEPDLEQFIKDKESGVDRLWGKGDHRFKTVMAHWLSDRGFRCPNGAEGIAICISSLPSLEKRMF